MTEMLSDGSGGEGRFTDFSRYPLPPLVPREDVQFDSYGRYKLPSPTTGRPTSYTRATTLSSTTADHYGLSQWKVREKVAAVMRAFQAYAELGNLSSDQQRAEASAYMRYQKAVESGKGGEINNAIDYIHDLTGGADSRELGQFVHDWIAELDMGRVLFHQLPEKVKPYAHYYQEALLRAGLVAVPEYTERVVLNDRGEETVAGRIDRIMRVVETGELILGDIKTSKSLELARMEYAIQFAVYGYATMMLSLDGLTWEPMPTISDRMCVVLHVPSDKPEDSEVVPFDLYAGGEGLITAIKVRQQRKEIPKAVMGHTTPVPSKETLRYVEARQAIQNITSADDCISIREQYEDIWTDDLTEFGATCFGLIATQEME